MPRYRGDILSTWCAALPYAVLKGHRHDWSQCLFTKNILHEILLESYIKSSKNVQTLLERIEQ